jgi:group I intron endonuclease
MGNGKDKIYSVYKHTSPSGKSYIGITSMNPPSKRWANGKGYYRNVHFFNAINKYGWDNFKHEILATELTEDEAKNMEIELIDKLQTHISKYGYNVTLGGDGYLGVDNRGEKNPMYGKHHTEETKQLLREKSSGENSAWYGRHHTEESKQKAHDSCTWKVPVVQLTLQGKFVKEFDSCTNAAKYVGGEPSHIICCCNGDLKSAYGFMWVKQEDYNDSNIASYKNNKFKSVVQLREDWTYIDKYISTREASRSINGHHQNIGQSCKSKGMRISNGFRWMYEEDYMTLNNDKEK